MFLRTKLPSSATISQRLYFFFARDFFYFFFEYIPYAPIRRINKPDLSGPYIWACSHSNFMCDGVPAGTEGPVPTKFLVKSTLFIFPIKGILEITGALPLARAADFKEKDKSLRASQNRSTFKVAIQALQKGWPIAIYPEGVSNESPGLTLPLKPGAAKLALLAEEENDFKLGLRIIPVGLEYGSRTKVGSGLNIRYGNPIQVRKYRAQYEKDQDQAVRALMDELTEEMIGCFPHFRDETKLLLGKKLVALGICRTKFDAAQLFLRKLGDTKFWDELGEKLHSLEEESKELGIPIPAWGHRHAWRQLGPMRRPGRMLYIFLGAPLFFLDLFNNTLPEFFLSSVAEFLSADETERMSFRFYLAPFVLALVLGLQFLFLKREFPQFAAAGFGTYVLYYVGSTLLWYFAVHWRRQCKRWASQFFFWWAGVNSRSKAEACYQELRKYLGQF